MSTTEEMQLFTMTQCNTATLAVEPISILQITLSFFLTDMISVTK